MNRLEVTFDTAQLLHALKGRMVVPDIPAGRTPRVEHVEATPPEPERDEASSWSAYMFYRDASGRESERSFTMKQISGHREATTISVFCHKREAVRTFRVDRIVELTCLSTGEVLDPRRHFETMRATGAVPVEDKVLTDVVRILSFLARCDGEFHPVERTTIEERLSHYCLRFDGTDPMCSAATKILPSIAPDAADMVKALTRISKLRSGDRVARFVLDSGAAVIDADGRHAPEEIAWALALSDALKSIADRR